MVRETNLNPGQLWRHQLQRRSRAEPNVEAVVTVGASVGTCLRDQTTGWTGAYRVLHMVFHVAPATGRDSGQQPAIVGKMLGAQPMSNVDRERMPNATLALSQDCRRLCRGHRSAAGIISKAAVSTRTFPETFAGLRRQSTESLYALAVAVSLKPGLAPIVVLLHSAATSYFRTARRTPRFSWPRGHRTGHMLVSHRSRPCLICPPH